MHLRQLIFTGLLCAAAHPSAAQITISRGANLSVDVAADGRLAIDLRGDVWVVPGGGGEAQQITRNLKSARQPRWSPDGQGLLFEATRDGDQGIWLHRLADGSTQLVSEESRVDLYAAWHPSGERIIYASDRRGRGFDLWEADIATGLHWRITQRDGDETEAAWSANGRDLVYVHRHGDEWALILRRHGEPEEILVRSKQRIAAPSWRPDGSLLTWFDLGPERAELRMIILSHPRLIRTFEGREPIDVAPVSWLDRERMYYSVNGQIRQRLFDAWSSTPLPFKATIAPEPTPVVNRPRPVLTWPDEPDGEIVIHAARMFDGLGTEYQHDRDILISGGRIEAVEPHAERSGRIVIDMGDVTVIPGLIDAAARLPAELSAAWGPNFLTSGITSIASPHADAGDLDTLWSGKEIPGPRILSGAEWDIGPVPRPELDVTAAISTSSATGQPSGAALPTQFRILEQAGLTPPQALRAVGVNAAAALLASPYLGRIATGSAADLVLVDGDPLATPTDVLNVVAVVRNGRFYSVSGLIDRAKAAETVE